MKRNTSEQNKCAESLHSGLKILMIHHTYLPEYNGAALQAHRLSLALERKGCRVHVLAGASNRKWIGKSNIDGISVYRVPRYQATIFWRIWFAIRLIQYLVAHARHFNVIHIHSFIAPVNLFLFFSRTPGIQKITRLGFDDIESLTRGPYGWINKMLLKSIRRIINPINDSDLRDYPGIHFANISNGVDTELFNSVDEMSKNLIRKKLQLPLNRTILLYVGSFIARKRIDRVIKVMNWLKQRQLPMPLLLCVGPLNLRTSNQHFNTQSVATMSQLNQLLKTFDLLPDVQFRDRCENVDLYFKACDIFINLSESEGQSNVVLEAMASELPIIIQNLPGTKRIIVNDYNGFAFDSENTEHVGRKLFQLMSDRTMRETVGKRARQTTIRYDINHVADQMISLYQNLQNRVDPLHAKTMAV
ncbi:glycosyltransferase [candidate division KSB1 bacterium]|nr:glycosyltransferase [candidate division KSB1 bacterium]